MHFWLDPIKRHTEFFCQSEIISLQTPKEKIRQYIEIFQLVFDLIREFIFFFINTRFKKILNLFITTCITTFRFSFAASFLGTANCEAVITLILYLPLGLNIRQFRLLASSVFKSVNSLVKLCSQKIDTNIKITAVKTPTP